MKDAAQDIINGAYEEPNDLIESWEDFRKHCGEGNIPNDGRLKGIFIAGYIAGVRRMMQVTQEDFDSINRQYDRVVEWLDFKEEPNGKDKA